MLFTSLALVLSLVGRSYAQNKNQTTVLVPADNSPGLNSTPEPQESDFVETTLYKANPQIDPNEFDAFDRFEAGTLEPKFEQGTSLESHDTTQDKLESRSKSCTAVLDDAHIEITLYKETDCRGSGPTYKNIKYRAPVIEEFTSYKTNRQLSDPEEIELRTTGMYDGSPWVCGTLINYSKKNQDTRCQNVDKKTPKANCIRVINTNLCTDML